MEPSCIKSVGASALSWKEILLGGGTLSSIEGAAFSRCAGEPTCGLLDDEGGNVSAWYVMSALGLYNIAPGQTQYQLGLPQFEKATISLENGKKFTILNASSSVERNNIYLQGLNLNKNTYDDFVHDMGLCKLCLRRRSELGRPVAIERGNCRLLRKGGGVHRVSSGKERWDEMSWTAQL